MREPIFSKIFSSRRKNIIFKAERHAYIICDSLRFRYHCSSKLLIKKLQITTMKVNIYNNDYKIIENLSFQEEKEF